MKRLLIGILLFVPPAYSQDFIRFYPASGIQASGTGWVLGTPPGAWNIDSSGNFYSTGSTQTLGTTAKPVGRLFLADGLVGAPSLTFSASPTTGLYSPAANQMYFVVSGAAVLAINGTPSIAIGGASPNISLGTTVGTVDTRLFREAANHFMQRNSTNAQTFSVTNTYTNSTNYGAFSISSATTGTDLIGVVLGTGTGGFRSLQGSKTKVLTAASATEFVRVAIPQTAGSNYAAGEIIWTVFFADATDQQVLQGRTAFSCFNKAGTEDCSLVAAYTPTLAASAGAAADDLACTIADVTGLDDVVGFSAECDSTEMTETTLTIQYRLNMTQPNTVTPQ